MSNSFDEMGSTRRHSTRLQPEPFGDPRSIARKLKPHQSRIGGVGAAGIAGGDERGRAPRRAARANGAGGDAERAAQWS